jgi:hypothetical protein
MAPFSNNAAETYKLKANDDWLRRRQGLALPVLPPTTPEARQYFFSKIRELSRAGKINFQNFASQWNESADGKTRFYVTTEILAAYSKTWEKANNARASKELIFDKLQIIQQSQKIFAAPEVPFPTFLTAPSSATNPREGVLDLHAVDSIPQSLSVEPSISPSYLSIPGPSNILWQPLHTMEQQRELHISAGTSSAAISETSDRSEPHAHLSENAGYVILNSCKYVT